MKLIVRILSFDIVVSIKNNKVGFPLGVETLL